MLETRLKTKFTPAEYLGQEEAAVYKSEYYRGEIFAMVGGTRDHNRIVLNLSVQLDTRLGDGPCEFYNSDQRLHIKTSGLFTYPDGMVVCGKVETIQQRKDIVTNPVLIVEVLSESTQSYDRGAKFALYKEIPSLAEYLLIDSEQPHAECFRRTGQNEWTVEQDDGLDAVIQLSSINCELPLAALYRRVSWT